MSLFVKKFGGTSLATPAHFLQVTKKIIAARAAGDDVVVVVSAMAGDTAALIQLAREVADEPDVREYDALLATGELKSIALLGMMLRQHGCPAVSLNATQVRIITTNQHKSAQVKIVETHQLQRHLHAGVVPIVAGFQGVNEFGDITTLDRGGSDATAIALAYALKADECQIYTDVAGVFTADPHRVEEALRIPRLSYEKMLEMADAGAKVMQRYAVEIAKTHRVPLRVMSTFEESDGTLLVDRAHCHFAPNTVQAITSRDHLVLLVFCAQLPARELPQVVSVLAGENIKIHAITQQYFSHGVTLNVLICEENLPFAERLIARCLHRWPQMKYTCEKARAEVAIIGEALDHTQFLVLQSVLEAQSIVPDLLVTLPQKISLIFNEKALQSLLAMLHQRFIGAFQN